VAIDQRGVEMKFQAKVSGKKQEWTEATPEVLKSWSFEKRPGGWIIATHVETGERQRFYYARAKQQFWAKIHGSDFYGERAAVNRSGSANESASDFTAQFPGKVRKIMVADGQAVTENTPLLMIEAMKMEFAIKASNAGTVKKVLVTEGQQLTPGQKLLDFEDAKAADAKK
jgi:biotin carboxyl carrier protein